MSESRSSLVRKSSFSTLPGAPFPLYVTQQGTFEGDKHPCDRSRVYRSDSEPEDSDEEIEGKVALDSHCRKHVDISDNADGEYSIRKHRSSQYTRTRIVRFENANIMREYLHKCIPNEFIDDEHGCNIALVDVSSDYISTLQAKQLKELPVDQATMLLSKEEEMQKHVTAVANLAQVVELLESNHIFVVFESGTKLCKNPLCHRFEIRNKYLTKSKWVALNSYLNWGIIIPAVDLDAFKGKVPLFRRGGKTYKDYEQKIRQFSLLPKDTVVYCLDCLQQLWNNRVVAWAVLDKYEYMFEKQLYSFQALMGRQTNDSPNTSEKEYGNDFKCYFESSNESTPQSAKPTYGHTQSEEEQQTPFQFDGVCDTKQPAFKIWADSVTHDESMDMESGLPSSTQDGVIIGIDHPHGPLVSLEYQGLPGVESLSEAQSESIDQMDRQFGPEIQGNAFGNYFYSNFPTKDYPKFDDKTSEKSPTPPAAQSDSLRTARNQLNGGLLAPRSLLPNSDAIEKTSKQTDRHLSIPVRPNNNGSTQLKRLGLNVHPAPPLLNQNPQLKTETIAKTSTASNVSIKPIFAKSARLTDTVTGSVTPNLEKRFPSTPEIICICRRPANTFEVKIVQCANPNCPVDWYHYDCLVKVQKLSSLYGKWICDMCKAEKHFAGNFKGHTDLKKMPFSNEEIRKSFPGLNGNLGERNPYGMTDANHNVFGMAQQSLQQLQVDGIRNSCRSRNNTARDSTSTAEAQMAPPFTLGLINKFGLQVSTPYQLTKAYDPNFDPDVDSDIVCGDCGEYMCEANCYSEKGIE